MCTQQQPEDEEAWQELYAKLGATVPADLLGLALTHPSAVGEGPERTLYSNQRLEFLGDVVLGLIVAEYLYHSDATLAEGELTQRKAVAVQRRSLAQAAQRLNLGKYLRLGRGEAESGGRSRDTILADALEAVIGALYLAQGLAAARAFVLRALSEELATMGDNSVNVKNRLQEMTQAIGLGTPVYRTAPASGPAHQRRFTAEVLLLGEPRGRGSGQSKKEAESNAAAAALQQIQEEIQKAKMQAGD
ncbi:MAG TPA: ribonuclease III [Abditibacteriaceae bacterium]|nr:ribonuclease III [Abditibacteriaceae bacterium]